VWPSTGQEEGKRLWKSSKSALEKGCSSATSAWEEERAVGLACHTCCGTGGRHSDGLGRRPSPRAAPRLQHRTIPWRLLPPPPPVTRFLAPIAFWANTRNLGLGTGRKVPPPEGKLHKRTWLLAWAPLHDKTTPHRGTQLPQYFTKPFAHLDSAGNGGHGHGTAGAPTTSSILNNMLQYTVGRQDTGRKEGRAETIRQLQKKTSPSRHPAHFRAAARLPRQLHDSQTLTSTYRATDTRGRRTYRAGYNSGTLAGASAPLCWLAFQPSNASYLPGRHGGRTLTARRHQVYGTPVQHAPHSGHSLFQPHTTAERQVEGHELSDHGRRVPLPCPRTTAAPPLRSIPGYLCRHMPSPHTHRCTRRACTAPAGGGFAYTWAMLSEGLRTRLHLHSTGLQLLTLLSLHGLGPCTIQIVVHASYG